MPVAGVMPVVALLTKNDNIFPQRLLCLLYEMQANVTAADTIRRMVSQVELILIIVSTNSTGRMVCWPHRPQHGLTGYVSSSDDVCSLLLLSRLVQGFRKPTAFHYSDDHW